MGDTITGVDNPAAEPLPGYHQAQPIVFSGVYPADGSKYGDLRDALEKLKLNDASMSFTQENSIALGFGFRCGFLGLLHMEIILERLEREYNLDLITTAPNVVYKITKTDGTQLDVYTPLNYPDPAEIAEAQEPYAKANLIAPPEYVGAIMDLCQNRRGEFKDMQYLDPTRVELHYSMPLNEIIYDFFDALKSRTRGYGSLDYELEGYRPSKLVKLDILLNGEIVDALSFILFADNAYTRARKICEKLKDNIRIDASEVKEKTVLTLACMGLDWSLRSKIVEYNKSNDQYRIQVVDYSEYATDDDYNAGITKLTTEIISGSVPDLFLTSNLPIDKYAAKGVVADLYTFMDGGSGLSRDYFVPQVLKAIEKEGKLYELPTKFSVETAYALSSIVDQYDTWNVAAVQDAMTQLQEGATVFSTGWTKSSVLNNCLTRNLAAFVDWTTGKCTFDSEAFQQLLAFCNSFPDDSSSDDGIAYSSEAATVDTMDDPVWESDATRILSGKQLMATTSFYSFEDYIYNIYPVKDKVTFVGYPSESGEPGNSFYIQCPMAISSVTKYPDAAWDFVSTMIRQTNEDAESMYAFPISQEAFDKKMTSVMTEQYQLDENGEQVDWDGDGEPDKMSIGSYEVVENGESAWEEVYALTQEDIDQILSVINSATGIVDYDDEILSIVSDEVSAYFAGDKDVQTTANMIQSRVNLYVQEQR